MKKLVLFSFTLLISIILVAQDQTVNGNLYVANINNGGIRIGKIGDLGVKAVPLGDIAAQYILDFTGYCDAAPDQIGASISAIRFNRCEENKAFVQKTALAFYTSTGGWASGIVNLSERMRITPEGNI
ncbi:MAG: hypothetical protein ACK5KV_02985, partial [Bacteroides graminisolvens]